MVLFPNSLVLETNFQKIIKNSKLLNGWIFIKNFQPFLRISKQLVLFVQALEKLTHGLLLNFLKIFENSPAGPHNADPQKVPLPEPKSCTPMICTANALPVGTLPQAFGVPPSLAQKKSKTEEGKLSKNHLNFSGVVFAPTPPAPTKYSFLVVFQYLWLEICPYLLIFYGNLFRIQDNYLNFEISLLFSANFSFETLKFVNF